MLEVYVVVLIILIVLLIDQRRQANRNRNKAIAKIRNNWGRLPNNAFDEYDMESFSKLFYAYDKKRANLYIDDITSNDLELDKFYCHINSTQTSMGDSVLYSILRLPLYEKERLAERIEMIDYWEKHEEDRESVQLLLSGAGKFRPSHISWITGDCDFLELNNQWLYKVLTFVPFLALPMALLNIGVAALWGIFSIGANILFHEVVLKKVSLGLDAITQASGIIALAESLIHNRPEGLVHKYDELNGYTHTLKTLRKRGTLDKMSVRSTGDLTRDFLSIFKMIFLTDIWNYQASVRFLKTHGEEMARLIHSIGELDATICIASYRKSLDLWCRPLIMWEPDTESFHIKAESVVHPLIKNCTPNPVFAEKPILLTGSNASGKSTYLKTVALNTLMVHTLGFCLAGQWTSKPLFPISSMALRDSILEGESYFVAEIKSLKRIFTMANNNIKCLCVIDEVLRGTNTIERIAASSRLLFALAALNTCILAATHDTELTHILNAVFDNKHFEENITDDDIHFDYKLKEGKATSRNAIKLLKLMCFEDDIIISAEDAVASFENEKRWKHIQGEIG